jgi:flagellin-like hook-associated protein FlgL
VEISGYSTADVLSQMIGFSAPSRTSSSSTDTTFDNASTVEISTLAPTIALADTLSDSATAISIVTLKAGSLEGLSDLLNRMRTLTEVAFSASVEGDTATYEQALLDIQDAETEISRYVGENLASPESLKTTLVESGGGFEKRFFQVLDMSGVDGFDLLASIEVDMASVLTHAHSPAGCPICEANLNGSSSLSDELSTVAGASGSDSETAVVGSPSSPVVNVSSDSTATSKNSVGSAAGSATSSGTGYIDPLVKGLVWDLTAGESLSYSFYNGTVGYTDYVNTYGQPDYPSAVAALNATQQSEMRDVYDLWSVYAPFDFEEVTETASGEVVGDLRVAYMTNTALNASAAAFAYYPYQNAIGGDTWYIVDGVQNSANNASYASNLTFTDTTYGRMTALHEIGHSIGLSHPFDSGSLSGETLSGNGYTDDMRTTVMSYTNSVDNTAYFESSGSLSSGAIYSNTPMVYDIAAVEYLYGAITDANLGDTTYSLTNRLEIQTLVDSGGTDTIDLSNMVYRNIIDLTPGSLSSVGYATEAEQESYWISQGYSNAAAFITSSNLYTAEDNLGIAFSATIENVIGGDGDDQITGNDASNVIKGGLGNDTIIGGGGIDYALFSGNYSDYTISISGTTATVTDNNTADGDDGTDTATVEFLEFADLTFNVATALTTETPSGGSLAGNAADASATALSGLVSGRGPLAYRQKIENGAMTPPHSIVGVKLDTQENAEQSIELLDFAIDYVMKQRVALGTVENRLSFTLNSLFTQRDSAIAARSRIEDSDMAIEIMTVTKHKILQQAGLQILGIANNQFSRSIAALLR